MDPVVALDTIYTRYGGAAQDVLNLDMDEGMDILRHAMEKTLEDKLYARWISGYDREMTFAEFRNKVTPKRVRRETPEQTLTKVAKILEMRV